SPLRPAAFAPLPTAIASSPLARAAFSPAPMAIARFPDWPFRVVIEPIRIPCEAVPSPRASLPLVTNNSPSSDQERKLLPLLSPYLVGHVTFASPPRV